MSDAIEGVKILDFSRQMSAPYGTMLLGDFGADVIKVESIPHGDGSRRTGTAFIDGESGLFLMWNRNKRSVALDLRAAEGKEVVRRLIEQSDVLVENYRPGVADRMGIGYDEVSKLNPRLIYSALSAFGSHGPLAEYPGTDPVIQAMSGVMSLTGERDGGPLLVGVPVADFTGAMVLVQAVLLGLLARERTGRGQLADIPMLAGLIFSLTTRLASYWADGKDPDRHGSAHSVVAPYQVYRAADGEIVAGAWQPEAWPRFCRAIGREDLENDPRFATNLDRVERRDELNAILDAIFLTRTTADWEERFHNESALFGEVCSISRILSHPQIEALGMLQSVDHPTLGAIPQLAPPIWFSDTPGRIRSSPPLLGEHTGEILRSVGYTEDEIVDLADRNIALVPELQQSTR
jgi:crotonobetainyl-CoA:carnitine CoA-transferase CaiB-like acyl-CoA transferase